MTLEEAQVIINTFGTTVTEVQKHKLVAYPAKFPQSLLPYPKETIKEAIDLSIKFLNSMGKEDKVLTTALVLLESFIDDEEAYQRNNKMLSNEGWWEAIKKKK